MGCRVQFIGLGTGSSRFDHQFLLATVHTRNADESGLPNRSRPVQQLFLYCCSHCPPFFKMFPEGQQCKYALPLVPGLRNHMEVSRNYGHFLGGPPIRIIVFGSTVGCPNLGKLPHSLARSLPKCQACLRQRRPFCLAISTES